MTIAVLLALVQPCGRRAIADESAELKIEQSPGRIEFYAGETHLATYVYRDENILRPYFANLRATDGTRVTRRHPPEEGENSTDHADMHPGVWLAFGDLEGADFWRNRAVVEHEEFVQQPRLDAHSATFTVRNRYRQGNQTVCIEECRHTLALRLEGFFLTYESTFHADEESFAFGDQEEMGLGIRIADALRVRGGSGRMLAADGGENEAEVRGSDASWCDYSGTVGHRRVGAVLMQHPESFRASWYHARDYGALVANPFGRKALTGGPESRVTVRPHDPLTLRFGIFVYSAPAGDPPEYEAVYREYLDGLALTNN